MIGGISHEHSGQCLPAGHTLPLRRDRKAGTGICPKCGGRIVVKKAKSGRTFYGCENYPNCDFMTWDKPLEEKCPRCGSTLFKKSGRGARIHCLKAGCGYEREVGKE